MKKTIVAAMFVIAGGLTGGAADAQQCVPGGPVPCNPPSNNTCTGGNCADKSGTGVQGPQGPQGTPGAGMALGTGLSNGAAAAAVDACTVVVGKNVQALVQLILPVAPVGVGLGGSYSTSKGQMLPDCNEAMEVRELLRKGGCSMVFAVISRAKASDPEDLLRQNRTFYKGLQDPTAKRAILGECPRVVKDITLIPTPGRG